MTTDKNEILKAVGTMCRAAKILIVVNDETGEEIASVLEETALAVKKHYGLEDSVMEKYKEEVKNAKTLDETPSIASMDVDDAQDVIYDMCRKMTDIEEIMKHVVIAREMRFVCEPSANKRTEIW